MAGGGEHGVKAVLAALFANAGIAVAKFVGFAITGSSSMLAEAIHSVADSGNQGLLLLGHSRGKRKADAEHPFGYGRERYFWAFVVALVLFSMGGMFALYEGVEKFRHPHELESPIVAVVILVVAIGLETYSLRTAVVESRTVKGDEGWVAFIRHAKIPELPVVLLEDIGAMVGLFFALFGITMAEVTDEPRWDAVGTLMIGALLTLIAIVLTVEMRSLLIGETASPADERAILDAITTAPKVRRLIHARTQHLGPEELLVAAKLELDPDLTFVGVATAIDGVEGAIRAAVPKATIIYLEPDVERSGQDAAEVPGPTPG
jgi:cation diffusion facilitator family transporter